MTARKNERRENWEGGEREVNSRVKKEGARERCREIERSKTVCEDLS